MGMTVRRTAQVALSFSGIVLLVIGGRTLAAPQSMLDPFGIHLSGMRALNEIRASGGMHIGVAIFLLWAAFVRPIRPTALFALVAYWSGLLFGRMASLVIDGIPDRFIWRLFVVELVLNVLGVAALFLHRHSLEAGSVA
jgi:hypothetical protein